MLHYKIEGVYAPSTYFEKGDAMNVIVNARPKMYDVLYSVIPERKLSDVVHDYNMALLRMMIERRYLCDTKLNKVILYIPPIIKYKTLKQPENLRRAIMDAYAYFSDTERGTFFIGFPCSKYCSIPRYYMNFGLYLDKISEVCEALHKRVENNNFYGIA